MSEKEFVGGHIFDGDLQGLKFEFDAYARNGDHFVKTPIENGEMLISEEIYSDEKYYFRINNIRYGGNRDSALDEARENSFFEKNKDLSDEHETPNNLFQESKEDQQFNIAECEILGVSKGNRFISARTIPSKLSKVRKIDENDFSGSLLRSMGDLKIGKMRSGSRLLDLDVGAFLKNIRTHTFITARTGGGKSNSMKTLLAAMINSGGLVVPLIFEPHGEYIVDLKRHPLQKERLVIYNQDGRGGDNQLKIAYSRITVDTLMNLKKQMNWSEPQERFLNEAQATFKRDWFKTLVETPYDEEEYFMMFNKPYEEENESDFKDFVQNEFQGKRRSKPNLLRDMLKGRSNVDTVMATKSKLQRLARCKFLTREDNQDDLNQIIKKLETGIGVLIDMAGLKGGVQELFLSTLITNEVLEKRMELYTKDREGFENDKYPTIAIVQEEAHRVLGRGDGSDGNVFRDVVNEGRKYYVGLIAIDQQAKTMDPVVLSQIQTHIILGISDESDFEVLKSRVQKNIKNLQNDIIALMPGEAVISSPDSPFALPVKIYLYDEYIKQIKRTIPSSSNRDLDYSLFG